MGHKRKVSDSLSPFSNSSPAGPSHDNIKTPQPFHSHASNHTPYTRSTSAELHAHNSPSQPATETNPSNHLNSRTRKRFRDNRPDEATIHQTTLSKLYAAQSRQEEADLTENHNPNNSPPLNSSPSPSRSSSQHSASHSSQQRGKAHQQPSIHAFFGGGEEGGGGGGGRAGEGESSRTAAATSAAHSSIHTPTTSYTTSSTTTTTTAAAAAPLPYCEDCFRPLSLNPSISPTAHWTLK